MTNSHNSNYFPGTAGLVSGTGDAVTVGSGITLSNGTLTSTAVASRTLKLSNKGSIRRLGGGGFSDGNPGYTFGQISQLPGPFRQTRVGFYNPDTTVKAIGGTIYLGATATAANYYATDASGNALPSGFQGMRAVGFDQGGLSTATAIDSGSAGNVPYTPTITSMTLAARTTSGNGLNGFARVMTDWGYTPSIARTDGGNGNLLVTIIDTPSSLPSQVPGIASVATSSGVTDYMSAGITYRQGFVTGSASGNLPSLSATLNNGGATGYGIDLVHVIEAIFENKALTIGWIGDSISDLPNSAGTITGRPTIIELCSQLMTTATLPVCAHNMSWYGQDMRTYAQHALAELPNVKHMGACVIQAWSGNDPYDSDPGGWAGLMAAMTNDLAAILTEQGCYVILATPAQIGTRFGTASGYQSLWVQEDARIRTLGYPILDLGALWGQSAAPWLFKSGYDVGDGLHPAASSVALAAKALQNILTPLLPS